MTLSKTFCSFWFLLFFDKQNTFPEISCVQFRSFFVYRHTDPFRCSLKIHPPKRLLMWKGHKSWVQNVLRGLSLGSYRRHGERPKRSANTSKPSTTSVFPPYLQPAVCSHYAHTNIWPYRQKSELSWSKRRYTNKTVGVKGEDELRLLRRTWDTFP